MEFFYKHLFHPKTSKIFIGFGSFFSNAFLHQMFGDHAKTWKKFTVPHLKVIILTK